MKVARGKVVKGSIIVDDPEIKDGTAERGELQLKEVREDVKKLREEMDKRSEKIHCHVLVWGSMTRIQRKTTRSNFSGPSVITV